MKLATGISFAFSDEDYDEEVPIKKERKKRESKVGSVTSKDKRIEVSVEDAYIKLFYPNSSIDCGGKVYVDTETTGSSAIHGDMPWMISLSDMADGSWCTYFPVDPFTREVCYTESRDYRYLKSIVENPKIIKGYFNGPFDIEQLATIGIFHQGKFEEVSLQARVHNTNEFAYKLKPLSKKYCRLTYDETVELDKIINKLRRRAKSAGWKIYEPREVELDNDEIIQKKKGKEPKAIMDYWLIMYAHLLTDNEEEIFLCRKLAEDYCRKDTLRTGRLEQFYTAQFIQDVAKKQAYEFEMTLMPIVQEMRERGVIVNKELAFEERKRCAEVAEQTLKELKIMTGKDDFNPDSPAHVSWYMFAKKSEGGLQLPPTAPLATPGQYKTGYKEIQHLSNHEFVQLIFKHKAHEKAKTLFFDKYLLNLLPSTEYPGLYVIHPQINQGNTKTFRLSYSDPNLQQVSSPDSSARGADVIQCRSAFGPRPGYYWDLFDYSGQELRLLGGLMKIKAILKAVEEGKDIPTELGNLAWGGRNNPTAILQAIDALELNHVQPSSDVVAAFWKEIEWYPGKTTAFTEKQIIADQVLAKYDYRIVDLEKHAGKKTVRTRTKMCFYGKGYGAGASGVVGLLRCDLEDAKAWLRDLDVRFPEMKVTANEWSNQARIDGYITNAYGRKLNVDPDFAYRATNYRIQGTAAEMMKRVMVQVYQYIKQTGLDSHLILTIHDELVLETRIEHRYKWFLRGVKQIMESHGVFVGIPMEVAMNKCKERWSDEEGYVIDNAA